MKRTLAIYWLLVFNVLGILDAGYLSYEHFSGRIPPCAALPIVSDCGTVLRSAYAVWFGVPLAALGLLHYLVLFSLLATGLGLGWRWARGLATFQTVVGVLVSLYLVFLQLAVLQAICLFCMVSAGISTVLFLLAQWLFVADRQLVATKIFGWAYRSFVKPTLFLIDAEIVHEYMVKLGQFGAQLKVGSWFFTWLFGYRAKQLSQKVAGITFASPVGLAAGFDYEARLPQVTPALGFGFQTIGTITYHPYKGNPTPRLGRLPNSKSLLVNKGFKNLGAVVTATSLTGQEFSIPIGISVGRTNSHTLTTQAESVHDIAHTFQVFERLRLRHAYYELNISCPNLFGSVTFYPKRNLSELLKVVAALKLKRPVFVKMPIDRTDTEIKEMLDVIMKYSPVGVIFGNLQKNRSHPSLDKQEIAAVGKGNFSGKPTFERSNELIELAYRHCQGKLIIIGCGGIFSAEDAYYKITHGANLVQLITGMIYQGPQLIAEINQGLTDLLQRDGFSTLSEAVGSAITRKHKPKSK